MTIKQIKYILEVSKSSSMREAASRLYVSQPALSASIQELEEELGISIFERTNKGIKVTEAGKEFLSYAKKAVNQYEILEDRYLGKDKEKEHFAVSTQHYSFAVHAFTKMISQEEPEKYQFSIHETRTDQVLSDVRDMKSEVGIVSYAGDNEKVMKKIFREYQLTFVPLMKKDTYAYLWKDHELAKREEISVEELRAYPCIMFEQNSESDYYLSEEALGNYSFDKVAMSGDRATSLEMIAELNGFSIGSGMLSGDDAILQGIVSVKLKEEDPLTIGYITRKGSKLSVYGERYIQELERYKEL